MKHVQLLWFAGCPNHVVALATVSDAVLKAGVPAAIESVHADDEQTALRLNFPGSPTIRVDEVDIEPAYAPAGSFGTTCRVYMTAEGLRGLPEREWLVRALEGTAQS